jgi:hypothetical protein
MEVVTTTKVTEDLEMVTLTTEVLKLLTFLT